MLSLFDRLENPERRSQLADDPTQLAELSAVEVSELNAVVATGENQGQSLLFWLCLTDEQNNLLDTIQDIHEKITHEGLNTVIPTGPFSGYSVIYILTSSEKGRRVFCQGVLLSFSGIVGRSPGRSPNCWCPGLYFDSLYDNFFSSKLIFLRCIFRTWVVLVAMADFKSEMTFWTSLLSY